LFNIILLLVAMHVAAIIAYRVIKKQNLVRPC
jgi:cytochrome b